MVNTPEGFVEIYSLWERVWQAGNRLQKFESPVNLNEDYLAWAERELESMGVAPGDNFVGLHIRELPESFRDERAPQIESYFDAINHLVSSGYTVLRFGKSQRSFPDLEGLIDLVALQGGLNSLDAYVIAKSQFLVSTNSGPAYLASELGVPVLHTNTIALGRQSLSAPQGTRYLPKRYFDRETGRELPLSQLLSGPVGFFENFHGSKSFLPQGQLNSAREIRLATEEMIEWHRSRAVIDPSVQDTVRQIREANGAISYGEIAGSFIDASPNWLA